MQALKAASGAKLIDDLVGLGFSSSQASAAVGHAEPDASLATALGSIPVNFEALPLLIEGHSKVVRRWTSKLVLIRLKPTVYSYTHNRLGEARGTDAVRARFSNAIYGLMSRDLGQSDSEALHAHVGLIETCSGPLLIQREVQTCNLEVRVKRFHIGSPLHRYRGTENHVSVLASGPVRRWSRFPQPIVCFDWRHPLVDEQGVRLADEPLSDDYAGLWIDNAGAAKRLAREAFLWLEGMFSRGGFTLVDICFFIDRSGRRLYGEISPDCMRVRIGRGALEDLQSFDKDVWREGKTEAELLDKYQQMLDRLLSPEVAEV